jgi:hypothetical protein
VDGFAQQHFSGCSGRGKASSRVHRIPERGESTTPAPPTLPTNVTPECTAIPSGKRNPLSAVSASAKAASAARRG